MKPHDPRSNRPVHVLRPTEPRKKPAAPAHAGPSRPPGYYTALMREHRWPPRFEPQLGIVQVVLSTGETPSEVARRNRELRMAAGETGTIPDLSDKSNARHRPALSRLLPEGR